MKKRTKEFLGRAIMLCDSEEFDSKKFGQNVTELAKIVTLDGEEMKEVKEFFDGFFKLIGKEGEA